MRQNVLLRSVRTIACAHCMRMHACISRQSADARSVSTSRTAAIAPGGWFAPSLNVTSLRFETTREADRTTQLPTMTVALSLGRPVAAHAVLEVRAPQSNQPAQRSFITDLDVMSIQMRGGSVSGGHAHCLLLVRVLECAGRRRQSFQQDDCIARHASPREGHAITTSCPSHCDSVNRCKNACEPALR